MILILGDIHFSASKPYFIEVAEKFIEWFEGWEYNKKGNELILAGDLVAYAVNGGLVHEFLYRFFNASKFDHVHVVVGNHDKKLKDNIQQLAYSFLNYANKVTVYEEPTILKIQGMDVLLLPFYKSSGHQKSMQEEYSNLYKNKKYQVPFDLMVGHFSDDTVSFESSDTIYNLDKLNIKTICMGHIHNRIKPDLYIGSIYANRVNENAKDRAAWIITKEGKEEDLLPEFLEFLTVRYPDPLPPSDSLVPVYTITNCASEKIAREKYGDNIFIKTVLKGIGSSFEFSGDLDADSILNIKIDETFREFMKAQDPPLDRKVAQTCLTLLENITNSKDGN